jgi:glycosyltransferase involved in cell wall biosynthesis
MFLYDYSMRSFHIPDYISQFWNANPSNPELIVSNKAAYERLKKNGKPLISVVIPAYNEEKNILQTLGSLCNNTTKFAAEIIVVNNNTASLVQACGIPCVLETKQGITAARNAGLQAATGSIILNADADTIYPAYWIEHMATPLLNNSHVAMVYGSFSFIPTGSTPRWVYVFYEYFAGIARWINKYAKDEAVNVYGFNSGFRRQEGIEVNGFEHPPGTNEDGWLAVKLRTQKKGTLFCVRTPAAYAWTSDRRIQMDGGLIKGTITRLKRLIFKQGMQRNDL